MSTSDLTPTVVLVHGAFVDASSWNGVIAELKAAGLDVVAPPNLLRGVGATLFRDAVCAEAPAEVADTLARTQRPASLAAFATAVTGTPAWQRLPSWAVVATADHAIHPQAERDMAKRAGSEITEIDASHAVPATHPADVAAVIVRAVKAIR
jgi:pimeloyl-ACP methyl ester carboxylesterase